MRTELRAHGRTPPAASTCPACTDLLLACESLPTRRASRPLPPSTHVALQRLSVCAELYFMLGHMRIGTERRFARVLMKRRGGSLRAPWMCVRSPWPSLLWTLTMPGEGVSMLLLVVAVQARRPAERRSIVPASHRAAHLRHTGKAVELMSLRARAGGGWARQMSARGC